MIRVNNDYVIEVDPLNFTVKLDGHKKTVNQKTGEESDVFYTVGHYTKLSGALSGCLRDMQARKLMEGEYDLKEAIKVVSDCTNEMLKAFENIDYTEE